MSIATHTATSQRSPVVSGNRFVHLGLAYVGFSTSLGPRWSLDTGPISLQLIVACTLALLGWRRLTLWPGLRTYLSVAVPFAIWLNVSSIAAWKVAPLLWTLKAALWLVFIIPGLANLLRSPDNRKALFVGVAGAAMAFSLTVVSRVAVGREVFDMPTPSRSLLLGLKRSLTNPRIVFVIPFLVANVPRVATRLRWAALAAAGATVIASGGRAGFLGLAVTVLCYAVLRPGISRKFNAVLATSLIGLCVVIIVAESGGQAAVSQNRLVEFIRGKRTFSDEYREAHLKRAWRVGLRHPFFGVGHDGMIGIDDPAFDEIRGKRQRLVAHQGDPHNTFATFLGDFGFVGLTLFVLILSALLLNAVRARERLEVRATTAGFSGVIVAMLFDPISVSFAYLPIAYLIGALGESHESIDPDPIRG